MRKPKSKKFRIEKRQFEVKEIELLQSWIESGKPESGSNPLSLPPLSSKEPIGRIDDNAYSRYAGCQKFSQLPLSKKTKDGLRAAGYTKMSEIQRASLPHSLCGRDILGAAKTGSGKTLAFIIPALETLYKARWGPEDGVGCIIMSPTRELADQLFKELKSVGRHHSLVMGLLIGGSKDVDVEKERVNGINILVCTPGRLLQHMDETPYFDCSQLQVLVLDEADRILDVGFKKEVNAIISQLPKHRQTLLFSATQTKSVQDLARLSLKDPEYLSVHEESVTATPSGLIETGLVVPLDQKMDMLWSFIKTHLNSKILVFLSTCKQVKFVFEAFKKLRPGVPLKCLHGRMKQEKREFIFKQFCGETRVVLFATDVMSRGINFKDDNSKKGIDWVVQMDCPEDDKAYLHRVGRTARYFSTGKAVLFLVPSEMKMVEKLREKKIFIKFHKANPQKLQPVAGLLAALLVKYPNLQSLAQRAFVTYLRSIHKLRDKEVFDVTKLPIVEFSASLGLPMTPKLRFLKQRLNGQTTSEESSLLQNPKGTPAVIDRFEEEEEEAEKGFLSTREIQQEGEEKPTGMGDAMPGTRVLKKKKLKINVHRPIGSRVVFDEEGNAMPPLARLADTRSGSDLVSLDKEKVNQRYIELRDSLKMVDKEDKLADRQRRKEKRLKEKLKRKKINNEEEDNEEEEEEEDEGRTKLNKKSKIYFDNDSDEDDDKRRKSGGLNADSISLAEQEELALKLLSSMHS